MKRTLRILHLEASLGWGGQEMRILRESQGMRERGHEVFFAVMQGGSLALKAKQEGFEVEPLNFRRPFWIFCLFRLLALFRRHQIDIVNTHSSLDAWIGGIAARMAQIPIVRTRHLSTPVKSGWNSRVVYGTLADFVVSTCAGVIPMIASQSGKPLSRCLSVATGVDPEKITVDPKEILRFREMLKLQPSDFLVGTACVMRSWKGIDDFLGAADLLREVPGLRWVVIGGGHAERHHLRAKQLRLDGIVHFTGHLDFPFAALMALDAFALLSTANEGVSQALLQAAYLRKPLIATPTGGLSEVCLHRETGLQVPPFRPDAVAQAVMELKKNRSLGGALGQRGRRLVEEKFMIQHTLDQMENVFLSASKCGPRN